MTAKPATTAKGATPADAIKLAKESGTPSAVIEMEVTRATAEALAQPINGRVDPDQTDEMPR